MSAVQTAIVFGAALWLFAMLSIALLIYVSRRNHRDPAEVFG